MYRLGSLTLVQFREKENSEFKPVKFRLKIDLVSYIAHAEELQYIYIYIYIYIIKIRSTNRFVFFLFIYFVLTYVLYIYMYVWLDLTLETRVSSSLIEYPIKRLCATFGLWRRQQAGNIHIYSTYVRTK